jgi:hypothetical protein
MKLPSRIIAEPACKISLIIFIIRFNSFGKIFYRIRYVTKLLKNISNIETWRFIKGIEFVCLLKAIYCLLISPEVCKCISFVKPCIGKFIINCQGKVISFNWFFNLIQFPEKYTLIKPSGWIIWLKIYKTIIRFKCFIIPLKIFIAISKFIVSFGIFIVYLNSF